MAYAEAWELARNLKLPTPTGAQEQAMQRVLDAAAAEIDAELSRLEPLVEPYPALVVQVNLERASEHWEQQQSAFGILGVGSITGPVYTARDSWERHAHKLAPLKARWGVA